MFGAIELLQNCLHSYTIREKAFKNKTSCKNHKKLTELQLLVLMVSHQLLADVLFEVESY